MSVSARKAWWLAGPAVIAGLLLYAYFGIGWYYFDKFSLDLGSQHFPSYRELHQLTTFTIFGIPAACLLGVSAVRAASESARVRGALDAIFRVEDRTWIAFAALAGLVIPVAIRMLAIDDTALVDDEYIYRFEAQLIAKGHLTMPSPPLKLFYDESYIINDGRMYGMYFVGWPALMAPGVWLHVDGYMSAFYSALTVPPLFLVVRALTSSSWAKAITTLYLTAPMLMIGAATQMSHTAGIFALAWMTWCLLEAEREPARWLAHAGVAAFFSLAFFVRPTVAIGVGAPLVVTWALGLRKLAKRDARRALGGFAAVAIVFGAAFLAVNKIQTGSVLTTAYSRELTYARENGFRFSNWDAKGLREYVDKDPVAHWLFDRPILLGMAETGIALLRLNYNAFGWPMSFAFVFFARGRWVGRCASMIATYCAVHFYVLAPGIDTYGPHHYIELAWPMLLMTALGARALTQTLDTWSHEPAIAWLPGGIIGGMMLLSVASYSPIRLQTLARMADNVNRIPNAVLKQGIHNAIVFSPRPFTSRFVGCDPQAAQHNVYWRPPITPNMDEDILWVNHISAADDMRLMHVFPDRRGIVVAWTNTCELRMFALGNAKAEEIPDGFIGGTAKGLDP